MSRSLAHLSSVKSRVNPALRAAGFSLDRGFFRREVGDVLWFFDWQRPYDRDGIACIDPRLCVGSPSWRQKVGLDLEVRPGATQLSVRLAALALSPTAEGYSIASEDWERSVAQILHAWKEFGLPLFETITNTDDLVKAIEMHPYYSRSLMDRQFWEAEVWAGRVNPETEPYVRKSEPERIWSCDELMRLSETN